MQHMQISLNFQKCLHLAQKILDRVKIHCVSDNDDDMDDHDDDDMDDDDDDDFMNSLEFALK